MLDSTASDTVRRVCAWCSKGMGQVDGPRRHRYPVTHGICDACSHILSDYKALPLERLINRLGGPILVLDGNVGRVMAANEEAAAVFGKTVTEMAGMLGGKVTECVHAAEPGGCGRTVHCSGCTIRRLITAVETTGEGIEEFRAFQHVVTREGIRTYHYLISAEKLEDLVLLRIHLQPGVEQNVADC